MIRWMQNVSVLLMYVIIIKTRWIKWEVLYMLNVLNLNSYCCPIHDVFFLICRMVQFLLIVCFDENSEHGAEIVI